MTQRKSEVGTRKTVGLSPSFAEIVMSRVKSTGDGRLEGYLMKQSSTGTRWGKRWFILTGLTLAYYKSPLELKKVHGIVKMSEIKAVSPIASSQPNSMQIITAERTYVAAAVSRDAMLAWLNGIQQKLDEIKLETESRGSSQPAIQRVKSLD